MAIGNIIIKTEVRPCYVKHKKALFHGWFDYSEIIAPSVCVGGHNGGVLKHAVGLVEFENGKVDFVYPTNIRFADGGKFVEICFVPEDALDAVGDPEK